MALTKDMKRSVISKYRRGPKDTGSSELQAALLTARINGLTEHFKRNKKDHHSRRGLVQMVERRKKHLKYIERESPDRYKKLIHDLELRK